MNKLKGIVYALISSGTFGMIPLFSIPLMRNANMHETSILTYRYLFSTIAVAILCLFKKNSLRISFKAALKIFLISLMYASAAVGLIYSYSYIPSGTATTIHFLYPLAVAFLMIVFYNEKLSARLIFISLLALLGVSFLSFTGNNGIHIKGLLIALSTALTYALYIVGLNIREVKQLDGKVVTFYVLLFGTIVFAVISYFTKGLSSIPDERAWINIVLLAILPTVISMLTLVWAVKYAGSTTTSILGAFEPLVATVIGIAVLSEKFTLYSVIGVMLIILSVSYTIMYTKTNNKVN